MGSDFEQYGESDDKEDDEEDDNEQAPEPAHEEQHEDHDLPRVFMAKIGIVILFGPATIAALFPGKYFDVMNFVAIPLGVTMAITSPTLAVWWQRYSANALHNIDLMIQLEDFGDPKSVLKFFLCWAAILYAYDIYHNKGPAFFNFTPVF
eukprot:657794-Prymnesium_polylepis.1